MTPELTFENAYLHKGLLLAIWRFEGEREREREKEEERKNERERERGRERGRERERERKREKERETERDSRLPVETPVASRTRAFPCAAPHFPWPFFQAANVQTDRQSER